MTNQAIVYPCKDCVVEIVTHPDDQDDWALERGEREVYASTRKDLFTWRVRPCKTHGRYFFRHTIPADELKD